MVGHACRRYSIARLLSALAFGISLLCTPPCTSLEARDSAVPQPDKFEENDDLIDRLFELPFDQLMNVQVFSVTRLAGQDWFTSPAALHVITAEDIRRSGLQSIPELLRLAPGLHVAQIDANKWSVSSRGFPSRFNEFMLVQMDGRSLYTPVFSGTLWDGVDTVLEDIQQIEVIRGPGGTLWGANAVNGVVNITTKAAADTQGWLINLSGGTHDRGGATVRYGGEIEEGVHYRVYFKRTDQAGFDTHVQELLAPPSTAQYSDDWRKNQTGFRIDWRTDPKDTLTVQGDFFTVDQGSSNKAVSVAAPFNSDTNGSINHTGWNMLARWDRDLGQDEQARLQTYYSFEEAEFLPQAPSFRARVGTFDIDFQHNFAWMPAHNVVWGLEYRHMNFNATDRDPLVVFNPKRDQFETFSGFIQDTIELEKDTLDLILGVKLEHNDFSGFENQPGMRLAWKPDKNHTWWAGVARAVRTPSISDQFATLTPLVIPGAPGTPVTVVGDDGLDATNLIAYELGHRIRPDQRTSIDLAAFFNDYEDFIDREGDPGPPAPTSTVNNDASAHTYGLEAAIRREMADNWRVALNYTFLRVETDGTLESAWEDNAPRNRVGLHSFLDITPQVELNGALYYTDHSLNSSEHIPAYWRLDLNLIWKPTSDFELGLYGQNLLDDGHLEDGPDQFISDGHAEIERTVFLKATWKF